jgi:stage V sporulation protein B
VSSSSDGESTPPSAPREGILAGTGFAFTGQMATAFFTAVMTLFLIRALGPSDYGLFTLAVGVAALLVIPSDFGLSASAGRFVADHRDEPGVAAAVVSDAFKLRLAASALVAVALVPAAGPIADAYDAPGLAWPLRVVAIALFGQTLMIFFSTIFVSLGRIRANVRVIAGEGAVEATSSVILVLLGAGAVGAALGRGIGFCAGALFGFLVLRRELGPRALSITRRAGHLTRLVRYAWALVIVNGAFALFEQIDVLVIGAVLGTAAVGQFQAPLRLAVLLHYPGLAVASAVAPRLARSERSQESVRAFAVSLRRLLTLQALVVAPVLVWAEPISTLLFGSSYDESDEILRALAPFIFLSGIAPLVSTTVNYLGEARLRIPIAVATVGLNLGLDLILIPEIGAIGGAVGTSAAYAVYVPAHLWLCRRMVGIELLPLLLTTVRSLAAAGAMAAVLAAFGTSELGPAEAVAGAVGGVAAFAAVLLATRELTLAEVGAARAALRARLGRRSA